MSLTKKNMLNLITSGLSPATRILLSNKKKSRKLPNFLKIASKLKNISLTKKSKKSKRSKRFKGGTITRDERIARNRARSLSRNRARSLSRNRARSLSRNRARSVARRKAENSSRSRIRRNNFIRYKRA